MFAVYDIDYGEEECLGTRHGRFDTIEEAEEVAWAIAAMRCEGGDKEAVYQEFENSLTIERLW